MGEGSRAGAVGAWALVGLLACGAPAPPPAPELGGGFSVAASRGKVALVTFGYTACPDVCPTALARLRALQRGLGSDAERLEVVFVTVDPERDSAERLAAYVRAFSPRFHPVRLEGAELAGVLARYAVRVERRPLGEGLPQGGAPAYAVDHTAGTFVIDARGRLRGHLPPGASAQLLHERVQALLQESP